MNNKIQKDMLSKNPLLAQVPGGFGGFQRCLFQQMEPSIWKNTGHTQPKKLQTVGMIKNPPMMTLVSLQPGFNNDKLNSVVI